MMLRDKLANESAQAEIRIGELKAKLSRLSTEPWYTNLAPRLLIVANLGLDGLDLLRTNVALKTLHMIDPGVK